MLVGDAGAADLTNQIRIRLYGDYIAHGSAWGRRINLTRHSAKRKGEFNMAMPTAANDNLPVRMLRLRDVVAMTSLGSSTIYRKLADDTFPRPMELSVGCVRWIESEVTEWLASRPRIAARAGRAA
jgi:prophage regulatory protein